MKKVIIIVCTFMLVGCSTSLSSSLDYEKSINEVVNSSIATSNVTGNGFKYYKPRDFSCINSNGSNHILVHDSTYYYLNIDLNGYFNKTINNYEINKDIYFSYKFVYNDKSGYLDIRKGKNDYFYLKMMYNYSYIEVSVKEKELKTAVINSMIILSSVNYNDVVINNMISNSMDSSLESTYEMKKPVKGNLKNNILDIYSDDAYNEN